MDAPVRRCERLALDGFRRGRGRPKKYWGEVIRRDMEQLQLTEDMILDRKAEGKIAIRLDKGNDEENWHLSVGCSLPGKWILHWGVHYAGDTGSEWDQPPREMWPSGSIAIKDYAIETPLKGEAFQEVKIDISSKWSIAAINFVLKDEETGVWYQHRGRDFKIPLVDCLDDDANTVGVKKGSGIWSGSLGKLSNILLKPEAAPSKGESSSNDGSSVKSRRLEGFYEEHAIVKETLVDNIVRVSVKQCPETAKNILYIDTDLPGNVILHWGICKGDTKIWELPAMPYPTETVVFKNNALRTLLQRKEGGNGSKGLFTLDGGPSGFAFVVKLDENTWLNCKGDDFYIPLPSGQHQSKENKESNSSQIVNRSPEQSQAGSVYTDEIIKEIRNLVSDISSEKSRKTKTKETQETILQEIEKLAAEAYSIFRSSIPTISEVVSEAEVLQPDLKVTSGTGTGFEILCQGFNWESHKSGRWYKELHDKAAELSSLGFSVIWLPPPTDSVSPEGYMPRDLYNLNSRYGSLDELKVTVKKFHEVGIKVLGDVVLNHRCASERNQNGIWNIFGGRLNWDERAVVADDPHFQGRGNKSSGDNFHAAPNIDHSQEFVRKDIKEWLRWLREEIGYDGWRLDFVRGFWGGYVKDYLEATEPYFAVGEFWDSLVYTYGEMDHNQDAHRQRIIDWINATNGTAGAFDVTTKGILHSAIERCEYWRLSDQKGKPPGVVGWWPSRAVTFIENHDTGSTQGHWRFPGGKEMQGYAYILTHPGTPSVFFDHIFSGYRSEIGNLISLRRRNKINCRSKIRFYFGVLDVDVALYFEKSTAITEASSDEEKSYYKHWDRSNRLGLMFMLMNIAGNIKTTLPKTESAKELLKLVEESSQTADKSLAGTLMGTLTTMKFDGSCTIHDYVIEMTNIAARLKCLGMEVEQNFLVQFIINSLPSEYGPFQMNYNTMKDK
ncbi:Alpha-amylase 3, chloroplastic [Capsicum baccatum]|uniref:alpha-amylase n=1 Tax=Capsicum baccatum TaxID=33114 RepID=A0A2G2VM07_CAPBA|nr:Alpha-amylase 3, chloroplastic [Capsicum baccatum]